MAFTFFINSLLFGVGRLVLYFNVRTLFLHTTEAFFVVFWAQGSLYSTNSLLNIAFT